MAEKLIPGFAHSPIHQLPDLDTLRAAMQNPNHPFYVGKVVQGRNAPKIAAAIEAGRKGKRNKK